MKIYEKVDETSINKIKNGDVILAPKFLQSAGVYQKFCDALHKLNKNIEFEKMHESLTGQQLLDTNLELRKNLKKPLIEFVYDFIRNHIKYQGKFFMDNHPMVRFFTPYDFWYKNRDTLDRQGNLKIQGPHHDTWFGHSEHGMNLWMAMGRVQKGNGLSLFPETWNKPYINHQKFKMPKNQYLGKAVNIPLERGDLLFFHGELVHSSELNVTDETRFVLTSRFSLSQPKFKEGGRAPWIKSEDYERSIK